MQDEAVAVEERVRVVVVDDQPAFRDAARLIIRHTAGFELVGEAATGEDSVDLVTRLAPHLVLMDIRLPGISGVEATRRVIDRKSVV